MSHEQVLCFPLQSSVTPWPDECIPPTPGGILAQTLQSSPDPSVCSHRVLDTANPTCMRLASLPGLSGAFEEEKGYAQASSGYVNPSCIT